MDPIFTQVAIIIKVAYSTIVPRPSLAMPPDLVADLDDRLRLPRIGLRRTTLSLADFVGSLTADHRQRLATLILGAVRK